MNTLNTLKTILLVTVLLIGNWALAQNKKRASITVLNIDTKGIQLDPIQTGNLTRIELEKLDTFDVTDRYDVTYLIEKNKLNITNCYGKACLLEIGNTIHIKIKQRLGNDANRQITHITCHLGCPNFKSSVRYPLTS